MNVVRPSLQAILAMACVFLPLGASDLAAQDAPTARFSATANVPSIFVPVTVRDRKGRLVSTLESDKFRLFVDGMAVPIQGFWREGGLPVSYSFVLDTSGSMNGRRLNKAREAINEFVKHLGPDDEVCLITFGGGEIKRRIAFGTDPTLLPRVLESLRGYGTTELYDILTATPQAMDGAKQIRRVVFLFTDGVDTASKLGPEDALHVVEKLTDPLYIFGIEVPPAEEGPEDSYEIYLREFASSTGGRYMRIDDVAKLVQVGQDLRRELTMRYIISLQPSGVGTAQWRKITVKVNGYQVIARQGYRGTLP